MLIDFIMVVFALIFERNFRMKLISNAGINKNEFAALVWIPNNAELTLIWPFLLIEPAHMTVKPPIMENRNLPRNRNRLKQAKTSGTSNLRKWNEWQIWNYVHFKKQFSNYNCKRCFRFFNLIMTHSVLTSYYWILLSVG